MEIRPRSSPKVTQYMAIYTIGREAGGRVQDFDASGMEDAMARPVLALLLGPLASSDCMTPLSMAWTTARSCNVHTQSDFRSCGL